MKAMALRMRNHRMQIPASPYISSVEYQVPFYDTDAMGVVHHANYVRYLELARVQYLRDHDQPYQRYVEQGMQFVVTRVDIQLRRATRFDERLKVTCWLERVRSVSLDFGYQIQCGQDLTALGFTEHGLVDRQGKLARIPADRRELLLARVPAR
jgi:acyl-CoA thioester hydrolase